MTSITRHFNFVLYFNGTNAEEKRNESLIYLKKLFECKATFACIARDKDKDEKTLTLRGFVGLKSPCTREWLKKLLGKRSCCYPSSFGEVVSLCLLIFVDRELTLVGRMHTNGSNPHCKPFAGDPKFIAKILLEAIDGKDLRRYRHADSGNGKRGLKRPRQIDRGDRKKQLESPKQVDGGQAVTNDEKSLAG